jgi:geranylgeranyl diphosphate synthase type I
MIERKTAALIAAACRLGSLFAGASLSVQEAYAAFGGELGIAFQLQDDVLGVWGTDAIGKSADADILERKKAAPAVLALNMDGEGAARLRELYGATHVLSAGEVDEIRALLTELKVRPVIESMAREHYQAALQALEHTGARGEARRHIEELCRSLVGRTY